MASIERSAHYRRHDEHSLPAELARIVPVRERLGGAPDAWSVREIGDGNLNLVFVVKGPAGGVAVKQALPYVRMVGESWPLPLSRSHYEHRALLEYSRISPGVAPSVIHRDEVLALTVMELLEPHVILRRGLIEGLRYPHFAQTLARFLARSLFFTSDLGRPAAEKKLLIGAFAGNTAMCKITEDLIFTEPYFAAPMNRWTTPHLDATVAALQADVELRTAASRLKLAFLTRAEALAHGDLHTGSVMVTETDTRVIDAEFAAFAPLGFDPGMLIANLLLGAFAQRGHEITAGGRTSHIHWILESTQRVFAEFHREFLRLWETGAVGDAYPRPLFHDDAGRSALASERRRTMDALLVDALGFAGLEMIRRIVGLSHVIDFEQIAEPAVRAELERRATTLARRLVVDPAGFASIDAVTGAAAQLIGA